MEKIDRKILQNAKLTISRVTIGSFFVIIKADKTKENVVMEKDVNVVIEQDTHIIGDTIFKLRKEKGWTQNELAEKLQVSDKAISKWESNKGDPSIEFFPKLAELFEVTIDYLMTGKEQEDIVQMSKLELCAKRDDVEMYREFLCLRMVGGNLTFVDEYDKNIFDYIFKYESKNLFTYIFDHKNFFNFRNGIRYYASANFFENVYYMRLLCNDTSVIRDLVRLEHKDTTYYNYIYNDKGIYYDGCFDDIIVPRKIISDRIIDMIANGKVDKTITEAMLSNHSESYFYSPALSLPYIIQYIFSQKDWKRGKELLLNAVKFNKDNLVHYGRVANNMWGLSKPYVGFVQILETTYNILLEEEKYDLIELANNVNKLYNERCKGAYIADDYDIQKVKINKSNMSDSEKQKLLCVHNGILNIDEVLKLNDFKTIKKMLEDYPLCHYEMLCDWVEKEKYKELYRFALDNGLTDISSCIKNQYYNPFAKILSKMKEMLLNCGNLDLYGKDSYRYAEKDNYKYIKKYINKPVEKENTYNFTGVIAVVKSNILYELSLKLTKNEKTEGLTKNYFVTELANGNEEIVIIKLCVKLEAILKYDYKYEGTFEEMLSKFCEGFNTWDDEADDYDTYTPNLLHRLRMKRNNIVHSEKNNVELSDSDIKSCINYICGLDKEN